MHIDEHDLSLAHDLVQVPHMHFEVYRSLATATGSTSKVKTWQIAFPVADCQSVYASTGYSQSVANLAQISFAAGNVFSDGTTLEMASLSGSVAGAYATTLTVAIAARHTGCGAGVAPP